MVSADSLPYEFAEVLEQSLTADRDLTTGRGWETFSASTLGCCPRQAYLQHLGLRDSGDWQGTFLTRRVLQQYLATALEDHAQRSLRVTPRFSFDGGSVEIVGCPTCYDPAREIVYHVKPRNGWYKFTPPIERHLNQLQVYLRGLTAQQGQLVYVSMADLTDCKVWPADFRDEATVQRKDEQVETIVSKAEQIKTELLTDGIATTSDEVPFAPCGCYLCETETLRLPNVDHQLEQRDTDDCSQPIRDGSERESVETSDSATTHERNAGTQVKPAKPLPWAPSGMARDDEAEQLVASEYHVPADLQEFDFWVVWDGTRKVALAPWQTGTMYPCRWAAEREVDPRRSFEKAQMVAELPVEQIHEAWPFPDDERPEAVTPAVLLPHRPPEPPVLVVDFDNVRNPETGTTTGEVGTLLERLGGYAEISRSGTGVHAYIRAALPGDRGRFSAPLHEQGSVELYDHARFVGGTWRHVEGSPRNQVPAAQGVVEAMIQEYGTQ